MGGRSKRKKRHAASKSKPDKRLCDCSCDSGEPIVRPRYGNKYYRYGGPSGQEVLHSAKLRSVYSAIGNPEEQAKSLEQLGIQLTRLEARVDLQEFRPGSGQRLKRQKRRHQKIDENDMIRLQSILTYNHSVKQPLAIRVSHLKDFFIESDIAFFSLLEVRSPYGESYSIPVLGRGSFSCLGDNSARPGAPADADKREHCVSGASAGFLQRAALSMTVLLCLCELSADAQDMVVDFYHRVNKEFGYGYQVYLDYLVYCCRTADRHRISYLRYLCLEFNNPSTQELMTSALSHFIETRQPTERFFEESTMVMTPEELERDRDAHFSLSARAAKASMYIRSFGRQELLCCSCHVM